MDKNVQTIISHDSTKAHPLEGTEGFMISLAASSMEFENIEKAIECINKIIDCINAGDSFSILNGMEIPATHYENIMNGINYFKATGNKEKVENFFKEGLQHLRNSQTRIRASAYDEAIKYAEAYESAKRFSSNDGFGIIIPNPPGIM